MATVKFVATALGLVGALCLLTSNGVFGQMTEEHRMNEYRKRGYKWPLDEMVPETPGWRRIMERRFEQVSRVQDTTEKYNGWMGFITSALVASNYTENGWGLTRAPEHITKRLQERLHSSLRVKKIVTEGTCSAEDQGDCVEREVVEPRGRKEHYINVIGGEDDSRPIMVSDPRDNADILEEMKPMFEWWSGVELKGSIAYGIRAYRNDSNLLMHIDKSSTHVISGIFHVDRSDDAEPWPIVIEDLQGKTNQVYLEPGDLLFYESSKCFHGRPQTFIGSYYASLFMHYRPVDFDQKAVVNEIHYAIPEHWDHTPPPLKGIDKMDVVGTSFREPDCKNVLCSLDETNEQSKHTVNWYGPAPKGKIATTGWDPKTLTPPNEELPEDESLGGEEL